MFGYGISDFFAKKSIDRIGDLKTLLYVQLIGAMFIALYLPNDLSLPELTGKNIMYLGLLALINTIAYLALYRAFKVGRLSIVSPISSSFSVLVVVLSFLFFSLVRLSAEPKLSL